MGISDRVGAIFEEARNGSVRVDHDARTVSSTPPPRPVGDPRRLRELYAELVTLARQVVAGQANDTELRGLLDRISRDEPILAPPGSPWYPGSFGRSGRYGSDQSEFAASRTLADRCARLIRSTGVERQLAGTLIEHTTRGAK